MNSPIAGLSSSAHLRKAISAAPRMALPDMKDRREAEALPEEPDDAVSEATNFTLSKGKPTASAAICMKAVCAP